MLSVPLRILPAVVVTVLVLVVHTSSAMRGASVVCADERLPPLVDSRVKIVPPIDWDGRRPLTPSLERPRRIDASVLPPEQMEVLDTAVFSSRPIRRVRAVVNAGAQADARSIDQTFAPPAVPPADAPADTLPPHTAAVVAPPAPVSSDESGSPLQVLPPVDVGADPAADLPAVSSTEPSPPSTPVMSWEDRVMRPAPFVIPDERQPHHWVRADVLLWWVDGVEVPVVATTSPAGTPGLQAGVLGQPDTGVLWGGGDLFDLTRSGFRLRGGQWYEENDGSGWQAEFFLLGTAGHNFTASSTGAPILARPFFNEASGRQDSQLIGFTGLSEGSLAFNAETRMYSIALSLWGEILEDTGGYPASSGNGPRHSRMCPRSDYESRSLGLRVGPRFIHHDDSVLFDEWARSSASGNQFRILDSFKTENSFLGGEIGLRGRRQKGPLSVDLGVNLALGANRQELDVSGYTAITSGTGTSLASSGFYAQPTNSGSWDENRFSVVPSLELAIGYELPSGWRFSMGYDLIYWTNVLRAAEQIDPAVHPDQFAPATIPNSATRPSVLLHESDYLAHGLSFSIERRW